MDDNGVNQLIEILKWVGIFFAIGCMSYLGRRLSARIVEKIQRHRALHSAPPSGYTPTPRPNPPDSDTPKLDK